MGNCFQTFSIKRRMPSARRRPKSWKGAYCWVPVGSPACTASASERCMLRCKQKIGDRKMQFPQMGMHFRSNAQRKFPFQHMFLNVLFHSPNCETTHWGIDCKVSETSNSEICRMVLKRKRKKGERKKEWFLVCRSRQALFLWAHGQNGVETSENWPWKVPIQGWSEVPNPLWYLRAETDPHFV